MSRPSKEAGGWRGQRGSRQARGYGKAWEKIREQVIARDEGQCQPCLRRGIFEAFHAVDHIKPKALGGTDDPLNLECICKACHAEKSAAEGARAQGRRVKPRIGADGWPIP